MTQATPAQLMGRLLLIALAATAAFLYTANRNRSTTPPNQALLITATAYAQQIQNAVLSVPATGPAPPAIAVQATTNSLPPTATTTSAPPTLDSAMAATGETIRRLLTATAISRAVATTPTFTLSPPTFTAIPNATNTHTPTLPPSPTAQPVTETPLPSATATDTIVPTSTATHTATNTPLPLPTNPVASATQPPTLTSTSAAILTATSLPATATATAVLAGTAHTVAVGDTLYNIALRYNSTVEEIAAANGLADFQIFVGQALVIPGAQATPALAQAAVALSQPSPAAPTQAPPTIQPSATPSPTLTPLPPNSVNGLAYSDFVVLAPEVVANIRSIYARGQELGRDPHAFTRIGDSTIEPPHFLTRFDGTFYNLGDYGHLQGVIDYYRGSFDHDSVAVRRGLHTWSVFDPVWARAGACQPGEHMLACEVRRHNPSLIFVRLGSNDRGVPVETERNLRQIVDYLLDQGVIPIIGTKADRFDGPSNLNNAAIRRVATDYQLPLWDFDLVAGTVPGRGLGPDNVHMNFFFAHDWRLPQGFSTGHGVHNLTALIVLDAVWQTLPN